MHLVHCFERIYHTDSIIFMLDLWVNTTYEANHSINVLEIYPFDFENHIHCSIAWKLTIPMRKRSKLIWIIVKNSRSAIIQISLVLAWYLRFYLYGCYSYFMCTFFFFCFFFCFERWMNTFEWIFKYIAFKLKCIAKVKLKILMSQFCRWNNFPIISVYVYTLTHTHSHADQCVCVFEYRYIELYMVLGKGETKRQNIGKNSLFIAWLCIFFYIHALRFRQRVYYWLSL